MKTSKDYQITWHLRGQVEYAEERLLTDAQRLARARLITEGQPGDVVVIRRGQRTYRKYILDHDGFVQQIEV